MTPETILDTAEHVLRQYGPNKTTVVDVARALGVSHAAVYRHFSSKSALREAVAERWLHRVSDPLAAVVAEPGPATVRLRKWLDTLIGSKHKYAREDPKLFAMYVMLANESDAVIGRHVRELIGQLSALLEDGMKRGEFRPGDAERVATSLFHATTRFHNPVHAKHWNSPTLGAEFDDLWVLLLEGLRPA